MHKLAFNLELSGKVQHTHNGHSTYHPQQSYLVLGFDMQKQNSFSNTQGFAGYGVDFKSPET